MQLIDNGTEELTKQNTEFSNDQNKPYTQVRNLDFIHTKSYKQLLRLIFYEKSRTKRMDGISLLRKYCSKRRFLHILIIAEKTEKNLENKLQIRRIIEHTQRHQKNAN